MAIQDYNPMLPTAEFGKNLKHRVAILDVTQIKSAQVLYNTTSKEFVGLRFVYESGSTLEEVYFKDAISCSDLLIPPIGIE